MEQVRTFEASPIGSYYKLSLNDVEGFAKHIKNYKHVDDVVISITKVNSWIEDFIDEDYAIVVSLPRQEITGFVLHVVYNDKLTASESQQMTMNVVRFLNRRHCHANRKA